MTNEGQKVNPKVIGIILVLLVVASLIFSIASILNIIQIYGLDYRHIDTIHVTPTEDNYTNINFKFNTELGQISIEQNEYLSTDFSLDLFVYASSGWETRGNESNRVIESLSNDQNTLNVEFESKWTNSNERNPFKYDLVMQIKNQTNFGFDLSTTSGFIYLNSSNSRLNDIKLSSLSGKIVFGLYDSIINSSQITIETTQGIINVDIIHPNFETNYTNWMLSGIEDEINVFMDVTKNLNSVQSIIIKNQSGTVNFETGLEDSNFGYNITVFAEDGKESIFGSTANTALVSDNYNTAILKFDIYVETTTGNIIVL